MKKILLATSITLTTTLTHATLGPIPIHLNTEYRTDSPVIGSIASTLTFDANDIEATGANTFLEFLATIPSVGLFNVQGNVPAIFMRGNESDHTLVLIDGVRINDISSVGGAVGYGLKSMPLNDIEKIDIIKGAGAVSYGASAIAGVIAITTKKAKKGEHIAISSKFGTHNARTYALSASQSDGNSFVRLTHNKYTTDGINARTIDITREKDGVSHYDTQIKLGNAYFNASYLTSKSQTAYDQCGYPLVDNCVAHRGLNKIAVNINRQITPLWKSKLSLTQSKTQVSTYENDVVSIYSSDDYKSTDITLLNDIKITNAALNIGLSKTDDENTTDQQKFSSKDLFINWQKNINPINMDVNIGTRHIQHDEFGHKTIYSLGIGKTLDTGVKLTANYNTAFNAPSLYQASDNNNPTKLKAETSKNINLGLSKQHSWGGVNIALYKNTVDNLITYKSLSTSPWTDWYINEDKLTTQGIELSVNANMAGYAIAFNHNYNKSRKNDATTQSLRRPKNITNFTLSKIIGSFHSRIQLINKSSSLDIGNVKLKGYTLLNLSTNYALNNNTKVLLNIKNATDKDYTIANGFKQFGRTIEMGLKYKF